MGIAGIARRTLARTGFEIRRIEPQPATHLFPPKFSKSDIEMALRRLERDHPRSDIWILTDGYVETPHGQIIDCHGDPGLIKTLPEEDLLFLYACDTDDVGLPWIREIVKRGHRFFPIEAYKPSTYAHIRDLVRVTLESEFIAQKEEGFAKWDFGPGDFLNIAQAIDITSAVAGHYVEIGCYRGSSACAALRYMKARAIARKCWFFDTFDGFSYEAAHRSSDRSWDNTHATEGESIVRARISGHADAALGLEVEVRRCNIIDEDLPAEIEQIAVANIDVDLYEAVKSALLKVAHRIAPRGVLIVEDPGHTPALIGSRLALEEFLVTDLASRFIPVYMESGQTFLLRVQ